MPHITLNGNQYDWKENLTVTQLLRELNYTFPLLIIRINGTLIRRDQYADTIVPPDAVVQIIHLMSGG